MKKYYIILSLAALAMLSSCGKMMDAIAPKGQITTDKLKDSDVTLLSNGVMHQFEAFFSNLWWEGDYLAENYAAGPGFSFSDMHAETQSASASLALTRWNYCYNKLQYANLLINAAEGKTSPAAQEALATSYYFRAFIYYGLVTRFGGVPLIDKPTTLDPSVQRKSEADVWAFIEEDLNRASGAIAAAGVPFSSFAFVSAEAISLLRAKVYLWE